MGPGADTVRVVVVAGGQLVATARRANKRIVYAEMNARANIFGSLCAMFYG